MLDHLLADRTSSLTSADITERFGHDAASGTPLHAALKANDKVEVLPNGAFAYKACSTDHLCLPFQGNVCMKQLLQVVGRSSMGPPVACSVSNQQTVRAD